MKFMMVAIIVLVLALFIAVATTILLNLIFKKKLNIYVNLMLTLFLFVGVLCISFFTYFNNSSKANDEAKGYLESTADVEVKETDFGYFFDGDGTSNALIFYPGARVEIEAYAPILFMLAERGVDTFIVEMPFNFPLLGIDGGNKVIDNYEYDNYYLCGHSLGGTMAADYTSKSEIVSGIILLASYPTVKLPDRVKALSIYGSNDKILTMKQYEKNKKNFLGDFQEVIIDGGNHSQFGSYGLQKGDGEATISAQEQQEKVVDEIFYFI